MNMQSSQLIEIIESFPSIKKSFNGVFSLNTIPKRLKSKSFLISNTQNDTEPGQHWFCIIKIKPNKYEYFDSLGVNEKKLELLIHSNIFSKNSQVLFNETQFQNSTSISCGLFVLYFIINRLHNLDLSFSDLLNEIFVTDCEKNETLVNDFAKDNF